MMRCFVALDFPRNVRNEIKRIQDLIKKKTLLTGRFTNSENLHLTLKFLGEIDSKKIKEVKNRLRKIEFKSFEVYLDNIGIFSEKYIKIIWIKLNGKGIFELQKEIDNELKDLFKPEFRFMSHITIARPKNVKKRKELLEYIKQIKIKNIKFKINDFYLMKSELFSEGPVYEDLEGFKLWE